MSKRYMEGYINLFPKTKSIRKLALFETNERFVLVGTDKTLRDHHIITIKKVNDTLEHKLDDIIEKDHIVESRDAMLKYLDEINANSHYFRKRVKDAFGIIGFVKFLMGYYLILITECKKIAKIGRHEVFTVKDTEMIRLYNYHGRDKNLREDEKKYKNIFKNFNLTK